MASVEIKTAAQLDLMRSAGLVVARTLRVLAGAAVPGVTTGELDRLALREISAAGAVPSFLGYLGYPATICTSVNEEVVHGIPGPNRTLRDGDLISIDCGAIVGGWHGDAAVTVGVGTVSDEDAALIAACEAALWRGIGAATVGARLGDIGHAVSSGASGYGVVREYTGHGIGSQMHMHPAVPNYGVPGRGTRLAPGMALAIEPMLTLGSPAVVEQPDGWTVVTADGRRAAHFEHTVAITPDGPRVLTADLSRTAEVRPPKTPFPRARHPPAAFPAAAPCASAPRASAPPHPAPRAPRLRARPPRPASRTGHSTHSERADGRARLLRPVTLPD